MIDSQVMGVIEAVEAFQGGVEDDYSIPREAGAFVHGLLLATGGRRCLEIGTSYGYSGLWILGAMVVNNGSLVTIDRLQRKSDAAAGYFADAGVADRATMLTGVAVEVLAEVEGAFDFVLIDADKEHCREYVELVWPMLAERGVILTDNTLTHADQMGPFLGWLRGLEGFVSAHVPVGNGMEMSVRMGGE